jgi:tRNA A37 threonylcarbamoyladenosine synthetase subunit TsaC/SUA5/YrdC
VLDLTTPRPLIRRLGAISREALEEALGTPVDLA